MKRTTVILAFLLSVGSLSAEDFKATVSRVVDGDTITVLRAYTVRLNGIDCPEAGQPFGTEATKASSDLVLEREVRITTRGLDKYGRTIADVYLPEGTNLNRELVKQGMAWWYREYSTDKELESAESDARAARRGLWADPTPVPPWQWRHQNPSALPAAGVVGALGLAVAAQADKSSDEVIVYVTRTGTKYHREGCRYLRRSAIPMKLKEARLRYTPCSVCRPPR